VNGQSEDRILERANKSKFWATKLPTCDLCGATEIKQANVVICGRASHPAHEGRVMCLQNAQPTQV